MRRRSRFPRFGDEGDCSVAGFWLDRCDAFCSAMTRWFYSADRKALNSGCQKRT
ncbi:unnamed protein product [Rhodiola kirilowii]